MAQARSMILDMLKTPTQVREEQRQRITEQAMGMRSQIPQGTTAIPGLLTNLANQSMVRTTQGMAEMPRRLAGTAGMFARAAGATPDTQQQIAQLGLTGEELQAMQLQDVMRKADPNNLNALRAARQRLVAQGAPAQAVMMIDQQIAAKEKEIRERASATRTEERAQTELDAKVKQLDAQAQYYKAQAANEGKPDEVRLMEYYEGLPEDKRKTFIEDFVRPGSDLPKDVQSYLFFDALPEEKQKNFLNLQRRGQVINRGNQIDVLDAAGNVTQTFDVQPKPGETAEHRAAVVVAEETAKDQTKAELDLPSLQSQTQDALDLIAQIKNDPSLAQVIGAGALLNPLAKLPGTPAQKTKGDIDRLAGKVFLQAYAQLRGAQGITDIEGEKATQAIANLNKLQNVEDFNASLTELENVLKRELGVVSGIASKGKKPIKRYNPETGEFE